MAVTIRLKRGLKANLPILQEGEPAWCTDTYELFIGDGTTNHEVIVADKFTANSILKADTAASPTALIIAEGTVVGRLVGGTISALTGAQVWEILSGTPTAPVSMNSQRLTNLADPTDAQDATTKSYVDNLVATGLTFHEAVLDKDLYEPPATPATGDRYWIGALQLPIIAVDTTNKIFSVSGDYSAKFAVGDTFEVRGSTYNDGSYTVAAVAYDSTNDKTDITVNEAIPDATADGEIWQAVGAWNGNIHQIAHYNGTSWDIEPVTDGDVAFVTDENIFYFYDDDTRTLKVLAASTGPHAGSHISGGTDQIDGDQLDISWVPTNYNPNTSPTEVTSTNHLTAHLAGIDSWLGNHEAASGGVHGVPSTETILHTGSVIDGGTF